MSMGISTLLSTVVTLVGVCSNDFLIKSTLGLNIIPSSGDDAMAKTVAVMKILF